ncbi:MAG: C25 family cysteine peptidase [Anaerolineaceae bacterium]|nr:C25 family cysteine peptidase [Anaerolineaceae bacterium]
MIFHKNHVGVFISLIILLVGCQSPVLKQSLQDNISQLRIIVGAEGFYQVSFNELTELGLKVDDINELNLNYLGHPHPFWVEENPTTHDPLIRFYAPSPENNLSENLLILSALATDSHSRIISKTSGSPNAISQDLSIGIFNLHAEQQSIYLPQSTGDDRWLWTQLLPEQNFEFFFNGPKTSPDEISIKIQLWSPTNSDHSISVSINNQEPDTLGWKGEGWQTLDFSVDLKDFLENNLLTIQSGSLNDDFPQKIYLDWIEIQYVQPINLIDQIQTFTTNANQLWVEAVLINGSLITQVPGTNKTEVYEIQKGQNIGLINKPDTTYTWIPQGQFSSVTSIQPVLNGAQVFPSQPVDYLVIAPQAFHQTLQPLLSKREQQGLKTYILTPQQIYDHLNGGVPSPDSIRDHINHLSERYPDRLQYLLLIGDYSYEILDYQQSIELIPSFFIDTSFGGQTISDFPFADLDGDSLPDLAVGRIPASTKEELAVWVEKILKYEEKLPSEWNKIIAISDPQDEVFTDTAQDFILPLQNQYQTLMINLSSKLDTSSTIMNAFSEPYSLLTYFGHGSIEMWGKDQLLSAQELKGLPPSSAPPVVFSFSCLNGYFVHPQKTSLAEGLLFHPDGGAIALLAPTGQTLQENQIALSNQINSGLQLANTYRLGNLITSAMREIYPGKSLNTDILHTFLLFGDPAMILPKTIPEID